MQQTDIAPSEYCPHFSSRCPCILTEISLCPLCGQLGEKDYCDCNWPGRCIFLEKRDTMDIPSVAPGMALRAQQFPFSDIGDLYFAHVNAKTLTSLEPFSIVHLIHQKPPEHVSIPAIVIEIYRQSNLVLIALNTSSIREKYFLNNNESFKLATSNQPAVLGWDKLDYQQNTLMVASEFGVLPAAFAAKKFTNLTLMLPQHVPPFIQQHLYGSTIVNQLPNLKPYSQLILLQKYSSQKQILKKIKLHPSLKISLLNHNIFS